MPVGRGAILLRSV